ncbi:transposase [uncultured Nocardioides sp.]|uniref:IS110 family transposase n=1 Tax=uncultured Nocardioides sp. TaxID=198441 RepID=UPI002639E454|nr:transposase [uncultured Nocardioides sp.]
MNQTQRGDHRGRSPQAVGHDRGRRPARTAARVRLFDTGHNRKTDAHDAHAVAAVAVRTKNLRVLQLDGELEALRMLTDRREALTRRRVQTVDRLHALLAELLPGQAKRDLTTGQARAMLASVRPRDIAGKTRRRIAAEELTEMVAVEAEIKKSTAELTAIVLARGSRLMDLRGVGPVVAARVLADVGDVTRSVAACTRVEATASATAIIEPARWAGPRSFTSAKEDGTSN